MNLYIFYFIAGNTEEDCKQSTTSLLHISPGCGSLTMRGLQMPDQLILGQSASLGCDFDLEHSRLYSVNWYKDGKEFFRFMPSMENKVQVFPVDGVNVEVRSQS